MKSDEFGNKPSLINHEVIIGHLFPLHLVSRNCLILFSCGSKQSPSWSIWSQNAGTNPNAHPNPNPNPNPSAHPTAHADCNP